MGDVLGARRREFGAFLRSRREKLTPAEIGLPSGARRRTPGLRREEVAIATGIGTTWYTWLEQGRDVKPSAEVLERLADTLKLSIPEKRHLYIIAGRPLPTCTVPVREAVSPRLLRLIDGFHLQPAQIIGRRWDVLAWNSAATAVFGDYGALPAAERNVVYQTFLNPERSQRMEDWEDIARLVLGHFRMDSARYFDDPGFAGLIETLNVGSPAFREWWPKRDVVRLLSGTKHFHHPTAGRLSFEYTSLSPDDGSDMRILVYQPLDEDDTVGKLGDLLQDMATRRELAATDA